MSVLAGAHVAPPFNPIGFACAHLRGPKWLRHMVGDRARTARANVSAASPADGWDPLGFAQLPNGREGRVPFPISSVPLSERAEERLDVEPAPGRAFDQCLGRRAVAVHVDLFA